MQNLRHAGQTTGATLKRRGSIPRLGAGHTRQAGKRKSPGARALFLPCRDDDRSEDCRKFA
ncbi:hypothetical protein GDH07_18875 [Pseudomonas sp. MC042]|uniref:Uncharacterized protein n=1 Tax=Pseudomonas piscis TaxID=2614538 RepID=A0A7X1PND2_9PSED|nr:hypothetical protein [Pseudomonas piscis]